MSNEKLIILPFNTELEVTRIKELGRRIIASFNGFYSSVDVIEPRIATPEDYPDPALDIDYVKESWEAIQEKEARRVFAQDVALRTYTTLNGNPKQGLYRILAEEFGPTHALVVTDMLINYGGLKAGGVADRELRKVTATTYSIRRDSASKNGDELDRRWVGVARHELGHLFGLEHHDTLLLNGKHCPMINRSWDDPEFKTPKGIAAYMDSRGDRFCSDCTKTIDSFK